MSADDVDEMTRRQLTRLGFINRQVTTWACGFPAFDPAFRVGEISSVERSVALEGDVLVGPLVQGDVGDVARKDGGELSERHGCDASGKKH